MNREDLGSDVPVLHLRIVQLRKSKKLTQEGMASKIGVTRSALSQYELGLRQPDYEIVKRIADYFNVSTDDLLGRETKNELHNEETEDEADRKLALELFDQIKDPIKREEAKSYMKYLANQQKE